MAVKIKARGTATAKPADEAPKPTRRGKAAPAAKRTPAKRDSTPTPKRTNKPTTARRGVAKMTPVAKTEPTEPRAPVRRDTGVDARLEARLLKLVEKMGERRAKAEAEHKEAINSLHEAATEALDAGVSMAKVSDASGISRQWLYKMGDFRGRGNGASATKPAAKPAATKPVPTRSTVRKSTGTRSASKATGGSRRRVAIKSAG